jgi:hypothetical protein
MAEAMQARIGFFSKPWTSEAKLGENFEINRNRHSECISTILYIWKHAGPTRRGQNSRLPTPTRSTTVETTSKSRSSSLTDPYCTRYFLFASVENVSLQNAAPSKAKEQERNTSVFLEELCVSHTDLIWFDFVMGVAGCLSDAKPRTRQARRRPRPSPLLPRRKR